MVEINKDILLNEIPIFANLKPSERRIIKNSSSIREFKKSELIYEEGSSPSALYFVILGRVEIYVHDESGEKKTLEYLHRGKYFGMISLLTDEPHSVTAKALNDCALLVIEKKDFDLIIKKVPVLALDLSRTLSRRLKRKDTHHKSIFESMVLSAYSSYPHAGKTVYALNIALSLKKETGKSVIILDIADFNKKHTLPLRLGIEQPRVFRLSGFDADKAVQINSFIVKDSSGVDLSCFHYNPADERSAGAFNEILSQLVNDYHYIILDLPSALDKVILNILNQSDLIQLLTSPDNNDLDSTRKLVGQLERDFNFSPDKIKIIINEYKLSRLTHQEQTSVLNKSIFATLPKIDFESEGKLVLDDPESEYSKAVRRIARTLGDVLVGLVLGVGFGYGFCHIGVLKVIEEEKIPIDVIAGSSMGAIIAALWVTGKSSEEILKITSEFNEPRSIWGLVDFTFPLLGFLKGDKLQRFLKKHLGDKTFYDVKLPLKVIASDIKRKEPRIFDKGLLVDAIMASCAMPGVFMPFKFKNELLVDGGVINPLPTEPLIKMGVKKIIAVNVTPSRSDIIRQYTQLKDEITGNVSVKDGRFISGLKQRVKNAFKINILDLIFSSVEILQSEVALKEALLADVVLHPDTSGMNWLQLHRSREFAKRGEEEARKNLDKIRQLISE